MTKMPELAFVRECLDYDPDTGIFVWRKRPRSHFVSDRGEWQWNAKFAGKPAGYWSRGYLTIRLKGPLYMAHRLAWLMVYGDEPTMGIDHIDGSPTNNRIANLRLATQSQQRFNARPRTYSRTGVKGVTLNSDGRGYDARITIDGKTQYLGYFRSVEAAAEARRQAAAALHGEFVRHG